MTYDDQNHLMRIAHEAALEAADPALTQSQRQRAEEVRKGLIDLLTADLWESR